MTLLILAPEPPKLKDACCNCGGYNWRLFEQGPGFESDWFKYRCEESVFAEDDLDKQFPETCGKEETLWRDDR